MVSCCKEHWIMSSTSPSWTTICTLPTRIDWRTRQEWQTCWRLGLSKLLHLPSMLSAKHCARGRKAASRQLKSVNRFYWQRLMLKNAFKVRLHALYSRHHQRPPTQPDHCLSTQASAGEHSHPNPLRKHSHEVALCKVQHRRLRYSKVIKTSKGCSQVHRRNHRVKSIRIVLKTR